MPNILGLSPLNLDISFMETFESVFAPLLGHRAEGFRTIFKNLPTVDPLIIETGCLRALGNWSGDGQSTFLFDFFVKLYGGTFYSIDINKKSVDEARKVCGEATFIIGDGTREINDLISSGASLELIDAIDLLYLDSFDAHRDVSIIPAPVHYMLELCAAWPRLTEGSLVAIDDFHSSEIPGIPASKGLGVDMFLTAVGAEVIHDDYMKIWRI